MESKKIKERRGEAITLKDGAESGGRGLACEVCLLSAVSLRLQVRSFGTETPGVGDR